MKRNAYFNLVGLITILEDLLERIWRILNELIRPNEGMQDYSGKKKKEKKKE